MKKREENRLIEQLFVTLDTTYQQVQENDEDPNKHSDIKSKIEDTLQGPKSWRTAYRIEQLMVPLLKGEILEIALSRNILRARELEQDVTRYYEDQVEAATTDRGKQALLEKLTQDLQWRREISHIRWSHINKAWAIATYFYNRGCYKDRYFRNSWKPNLTSWHIKMIRILHC